MSKINLSTADIIMLLLYSPGYTDNFNEPIEGRTKLTKMLFIFEKEIKRDFVNGKISFDDDIFYFQSWNFGPMSFKAFKDIDFLKNTNFIKSSYDNNGALTYEEISEFSNYAQKELDIEPSEFASEKFEITDRGVKFIQEKNKYNILSDVQKACLKAFKSKYNNNKRNLM